MVNYDLCCNGSSNGTSNTSSNESDLLRKFIKFGVLNKDSIPSMAKRNLVGIFKDEGFELEGNKLTKDDVTITLSYNNGLIAIFESSNYGPLKFKTWKM